MGFGRMRVLKRLKIALYCYSSESRVGLGGGEGRAQSMQNLVGSRKGFDLYFEISRRLMGSSAF